MDGHEPVKPFIWTLLPAISEPMNDPGGQLMTQTQTRWVRGEQHPKELKHQVVPSASASMGQLKLNTESCKLVTEAQFRRRKRSQNDQKQEGLIPRDTSAKQL